ncbi:transcriptional regulator [Longimycelium tulufanense]|uniref:Transcriptional regulator n=1 Tax=Longimycelium tulufanense TaxID=907463 RepID=A0A8J3CBT6_9PSEU|nr:LacI family DNA-binding transcriptional regulator [Longimycelium tulufanense]GGM50405.1 transcriptional regulator [Longimycelium tulufanense]
MPVDDDRPRRPTLDTIAHAVGVSRATVSNAYNRPDQLSAELRDRILGAARSLGYPGPNPVARGLATRRAGAIAFVVGTPLAGAFSDPALSVTLDGLISTVDGHEHSLVLMRGERGGPRREAVARLRADVVVAYSLADDVPALAAVRRRGLPLVVVDQPAVPWAPRVEIDDERGGRLAAEHLVALGHRWFGVLAFPFHPDGGEGPADHGRRATARYRISRDRLTGYLSVLAAAGIEPGAMPVWEAPASSREAGRRGARWLLTRSPRPTALLCMSDELALGAVQGARHLGLRVPEEVSVVGFDDTPAASGGDPPLTTIRQPLAEKGRRAGELALAALAGDHEHRPFILPVWLVPRATSGPPRFPLHH